MYYGILSDGSRTELNDFYDWCGMEVCIGNYVLQGYTEWQAEKKFWDDVRNYDPEDFDFICEEYDDLSSAISDGELDEIRSDYLMSINVKVIEVEEMRFLMSDAV